MKVFVLVVLAAMAIACDALRCKSTHAKRPNGCCTKKTPCSYTDGDCDTNSQCYKGLKCATNNCVRFGKGWQKWADCCDFAGTRCTKAMKAGKFDGCCTKKTPCGYMDGDCDSDAECAGGLVCGLNNCGKGFHKLADCCIPPPRCHAAMKKGKFDGCCTKDNPCDVGDGDCDSDAECVGKLKCGLNNCGQFHKLADCCIMP